MEAREVALRVAKVAKSKKALKPLILDVRKVLSFCDYFVILGGTSLRQVNAIAKAIEEDLEKEQLRPLSKVSGNDESGWVVLDFASVVVHIFYKPLRDFYSLEYLWSDAKRIRIPREL